MKKLFIAVTCSFVISAGSPQKMSKTQIPNVASIGDGKLDKALAFKQFRKEIKESASENKKIPPKDNSIFRIMTYNVHFWRNPENTQGAMDKMIRVMKSINPDIVILQEVSPEEGFAQGNHFGNSRAMNQLKELGFTDFSGCNTVQKGWFGNVIASKSSFQKRWRFPFAGQKENQFESRCYSFAQSRLSTGYDVYIYGTHLEVHDDGKIRLAQIQEIIDRILWNQPNSNALIAADFNATRLSTVIQQLERNKFVDCFTYMGWPHPTFTSWAGTEIDFIFLSPKWHLPLAGCYVYFDDASDHLPVIMDIDVTGKIQEQNPAIELDNESNSSQKDEYVNAVVAGNFKKIEQFIKSPGINASIDVMGNTPLHHAAINNDARTIQFLIANGADINAKNDKNRTPAAEAEYFNFFGVTKYLNGSTPLHWAIYDGKSYNEIKDLIAKDKTLINKTDNDGNTPLHIAAKYDDRGELIKLLIANGASRNAKNKAGKTPYDIPPLSSITRTYLLPLDDEFLKNFNNDLTMLSVLTN